MKAAIITSALFLVIGASGVQAETTVEKTTTTTYSGVVSDVNPTASTIVLRSSTETASAPKTYNITKETVFVDPAGKIVTYETVKDAPVTVSYIQEGDRMIVTKVQATGPAVRKETTTTTTTETR